MTEIEDSNPPRKIFEKLSISDTIIIGLLTIATYCLIYFYRGGYFSYFKLPLQFISFNIIDILIVGSAIIVLFVIFFGAIDTIFWLASPKGKTPEPVFRRLYQLSPLLLLVLPFLLFYDWSIESSLLLGFIIFVVLIMFLPPLLTKKYKGSYLEKMEAIDQQPSSNVWDGSLFNRAINLIGHRTFVVLIYFFLSLNIVYQAGRSSAMRQTEFYVVNTSPEAVVLYMNDDEAVCSYFNRVTGEVEPGFFVVDIKSGNEYIFTLDEIGPLTRSSGTKPSAQTPTPTISPTMKPTLTPSPTRTETPFPTLSATP